VAIQRVITPAGEAQLKGLLQAHVDKTGSAKAAALLADWGAARERFWQLVPPGVFACRARACVVANACVACLSGGVQ
jgi:glutamate synthase domain-containing protein 3